MSRYGFVFDLNKCVGCMACVAGCSIENGTTQAFNWREVNSFNAIRHPDLPVFHFSLACNHCDEAPCMANCPAKAFTRDPENGLIIHHAEACIGCKYCTWACPYDAPKYNHSDGIIEKCTFCNHRIEIGIAPACVEACPVDALNYETTDKSEPGIVPGFTEVGIKPGIRLIPLRAESGIPEIISSNQPDIKKKRVLDWTLKPASKISLKKEWVLLLFTLTIPWLTAWFAAMITHKQTINPYLFTGIGTLSLAISTLHLGRINRAWRSLLHLKHSWLSREILFTSLFIGFCALFFIIESRVIAYIAIAFALLSLLSIDMVYSVFRHKVKLLAHSSQVIFSALLFYAVFARIPFLIGFALTFKAGLYVYRKLAGTTKETFWQGIISLIRLTCLLFPLLYLGLGLYEYIYYWVIVVTIFVGEFIDRAEFYLEADVFHPKAEIYDHFINEVNEKIS